jgi:hypothetical protein
MWIEGFLSGSGLLLIHDPKLLKIFDQWIVQIASDQFENLVPILRRTFSAFPKPERRQIGQAVSQGNSKKQTATQRPANIDETRAMRPIPLLLKILGGTT